ncbi:hypothetical protein LTR56_010157 [Elasticomyces elasticus]|nr:hypothetical protein LTR22_021119 [Elasticomyces elasticus]KAK3643419.1 hypothetical protein LTR56_010157 [Elasticomyces elasticus]KAK4925374.1 hypothetical protein LTR49_007672 [Elasticomyces elasticus]KAK5761256.1 hypothetical protein LTS12_008532 [Elasticomyces elasticus]
MASSAAVGANAAESPPLNDINEDGGNVGEVTSAVGRIEDGIEAGEFAEEEDDVRPNGRRKGGGDEEAAVLGIEDEDLFGDEEETEQPKRQLSDADLDSGDDADRTDRVADEQPATQEIEYETQERITMSMSMARQPVPEPSDGEMYLLKLPDFMALEPQAWSPNNFQPPTTDHHSSKAASTSFSAYNTALTTMRWRHSPSNPEKLQSNARILRWSDGSLTLQLASNPTVQYQLDGNPLAPPQRNALKPTPVSITTSTTKSGRQGYSSITNLNEKYDQSKDAFTYLLTPSQSTSTLRVTHKITAGLSIHQPESGQDDAIERLQAALATAANATRVNGVGNTEGLELIDEDPEEKRRQAEKAMKEKMKADKRREAAVQRESDRSNRALGRSGARSGGGGGGLSAGMLEDEEGGEGGMKRGGGRKGKGAGGVRRQRRNSIYSDDEDFGRKHFNVTSKEDEYDEEDDFVAGSDEEEEGGEEEEDVDDGIVEPRREKDGKRGREVAGGEGEADAEGEVEEEGGVVERRKKRRVVEDEEEDE